MSDYQLSTFPTFDFGDFGKLGQEQARGKTGKKSTKKEGKFSHEKWEGLPPLFLNLDNINNKGHFDNANTPAMAGSGQAVRRSPWAILSPLVAWLLVSGVLSLSCMPQKSPVLRFVALAVYLYP